MISKRTLFVLGAGSSAEINFPVGSELKSIISSKLNIKYDHELISGSGQIAVALQRHANLQGEDVNDYLQSAWRLCDSMPLATSIDNYLDAHKDDHRTEICGKLGIVESIVEAERKSFLADKKLDGRRYTDFLTLETTWLIKLFRLLADGVSIDNVDKLFKNASFITFNYDRSLEHFLACSLSTYYGLSEKEGQNIASGATVIHPYGTIGTLPWWGVSSTYQSFAAPKFESDFLELAQNIKTFTERIEEKNTLNAIKNEVESADVIVFLGFAFHQQNMDLLTVPSESDANRVFATAFGISNSDCEVIKQRIKKMLRQTKTIKMEIAKNIKCFELFDEFWRSLH